MITSLALSGICDLDKLRRGSQLLGPPGKAISQEPPARYPKMHGELGQIGITETICLLQNYRSSGILGYRLCWRATFIGLIRTTTRAKLTADSIGGFHSSGLLVGSLALVVLAHCQGVYILRS